LPDLRGAQRNKPPCPVVLAELRTEHDEVEPRIVALDVLALAEGVELDSNALPVA